MQYSIPREGVNGNEKSDPHANGFVKYKYPQDLINHEQRFDFVFTVH